MMFNDQKKVIGEAKRTPTEAIVALENIGLKYTKSQLYGLRHKPHGETHITNNKAILDMVNKLDYREAKEMLYEAYDFYVTVRRLN